MKSLLNFLWKETDSLVVLLKTREFGCNRTDCQASSAGSSRTFVSSRNTSLLEHHCVQKVLQISQLSSYHTADSEQNFPVVVPANIV